MQVDYESEEGEESTDEDREEVTEGTEQLGSDEQSEERPRKSSPSTTFESSSSQNQAEDTQDSVRVNEVLQVSSSIEDYKYDQENSLWCEVHRLYVHCVCRLVTKIGWGGV